MAVYADDSKPVCPDCGFGAHVEPDPEKRDAGGETPAPWQCTECGVGLYQPGR